MVNPERNMTFVLDWSNLLEQTLNEMYLLSGDVAKDLNWIRHSHDVIRLLTNTLKKTSLSFEVKSNLKSTRSRLKRLRALVRLRLSTGATLESVNERQTLSNRLRWKNCESAFKKRIRTGVLFNQSHIDPKHFLTDAEPVVVLQVKNLLEKHLCLKVSTTLVCEYTLREQHEAKSFHTFNWQLLLTTNLEEWFSINVVTPIITDMEEFQERDSGWTLHRLVQLTVNVNQCEPFNGGCYIDLPATVKTRKAVINVRSFDNACFAWAVVSALHPARTNTHRTSSYPHYSGVLNLEGITFPMSMKQIPKFERQNALSVNVFVLQTKLSKKIEVAPLYLTDDKKVPHINLLLLEDSVTQSYHFCWIKNLSRLVAQQISKSNGKKWICDRCLHAFYSRMKLTNHQADCNRLNFCATILPTEETKWLQFRNFNRKEIVPFVVYADFECMLNKVNVNVSSNSSTSLYQIHEPFSVGYYLKCSYNDALSRYASYRGSEPAKWFVMELKSLVDNLQIIYANPVPMRPLTMVENSDFSCATQCHICGGKFNETQIRVHDHCHFTGNYRGPAHNGCNLNYQDYRVIPVVLHNLTGYDAHFIITELMTAFEGHVSVLPINKERYISFTKTVGRFKLRFIDSFRFMSASLEKLASYMETEEFQILKSQFGNIDSSKFKLLTRKGIFPYEFLDHIEKLNATELPPKAQFYDKLNDRELTENDYLHAKNVWKSFEIKTLGEYSDLYLKTDILLLADVFENFRSSCVQTYGLDPAYYHTLPGLTWDAMLKYTGIRLELLTDVDMLLFVERGIRGGLSQCSNRYGRANNRYMNTFDPNIPSKYLMYFDVNNLYGWAMSQCLPTGKFEWFDDVSGSDVAAVADDSPVGYILEVDMEYPRELHDSHADLPFCPVHEAAPNAKQTRLLATLYNKERYVIHYRYLKQCLSNGLKLTKIHRVLKFEQSPWLKPYIDLNTRLRTLARNVFEKNLFKLMNNAVFGKTMENVRNYVNIRLLRNWYGRYGAKALIAKPNFQRCTIFTENFVAVEFKKLEVKFFKPIYAGMCILDIAKIRLYEFHYDYMRREFQNRCKLLYTDTDSLIYEINCDDIYRIMQRDIERFDTSDYSTQNPYGMPLVNKKVPGLMKDENNGQIMTEFVGLRSKMYSIKLEEQEIKKAKGVKTCVVARAISFADYLMCLNTNSELKKQQHAIRTKLHKVYSMRETKVVLSSSDTKRYLIPNSSDTLPWGHYSIPLIDHSFINCNTPNRNDV